MANILKDAFKKVTDIAKAGISITDLTDDELRRLDNYLIRVTYGIPNPRTPLYQTLVNPLSTDTLAKKRSDTIPDNLAELMVSVGNIIPPLNADCVNALCYGLSKYKIEAGDNKKANELIELIWQNNNFYLFMRELFAMGVTNGDSYVIPIPIKETQSFDMLVLDPATVFPRLDSRDSRKVISFLRTWLVQEGMLKKSELGNKYTPTDVEYKEIIYEDETILYIDGIKQAEGEGSYLHSPSVKDIFNIFHFPYITNPGDYFGGAECDSIIGDIDLVNFYHTTIKELVEFYTFPQIIFKGVKKAGAYKMWGKRKVHFPSMDSDISLLEWSHNPVSILKEYINELNQTIRAKKPMMEYREWLKSLSDHTSEDIKQRAAPMIMHLKTIKEIHAEILRDIFDYCFKLNGIKVDKKDIKVDLGPVLPMTKGEFLEDITTMRSLGYAIPGDAEMWKQMGYDFSEKQIEEFKKETDERRSLGLKSEMTEIPEVTDQEE